MSNFLPKNVFPLFGSLGGFVGFCQLQSSLKAEESKPKSSRLKSDLYIEEINNANDKSARKIQEEKLQKLITETKNLCWLKMTGSAIPGLVIAVSVDGKTVFRHGFGYADVENKVLANSSHVFRIASISKPLAVTAVARLYEQGKLDLDKPITEYVKSWPEKHPTITIRQIASHTSGIRHYKENPDYNKSTDSYDTKYPEFYSNKPYKTIEEAVEVFKEDDLLSKPGEEFNYTTHGFTLLSAAIESISGEKFTKHMKKLFKDLGLSHTYLDENEPIIPNRAKFYDRNEDHELKNVLCVDNSMKWAGGGFLSTVGDLLQFGNAMLYSFQFEGAKNKEGSENEAVKSNLDIKEVVFHPSPFSTINTLSNDETNQKKPLPPVLKQETMKLFWNPVMKCHEDRDTFSGLGWMVTEEKDGQAFGKINRFFAAHTGGAVGASSILLIYPRKKEILEKNADTIQIPQGVVVAIVCNMQSVGLSNLAMNIAKLFETIPPAHNQVYRVRRIEDC